MGNDGKYYSRDTKDNYARTTRGTSDFAEKKMTRHDIDSSVLPMNRVIRCMAEHLIALSVDGTGSMDVLPKVFCDKAPLVAGQIAQQRYLIDPMVSISMICDMKSDQAPIQVGDFCLMRQMDDWLSRLYIERGCGGSNHVESYEMMAYYYARRCELPNVRVPFYIFTGDEGFYETLYATDLKRMFGGEHETVQASQIFKELLTKFMGNVFLIHRRYSDRYRDEQIVDQWRGVLGANHVVKLGSDQAIADVILGLIAVVGGTRTLDGYADDMRTKRDKPQTEERIAEVCASLAQVQSMQAPKKEGPVVDWL